MSKIMKTHVCLKCKNTFMIGRYSKFEVLPGECANGKNTKITSKIMPKSMPKFMKMRCKIHISKN